MPLKIFAFIVPLRDSGKIGHFLPRIHGKQYPN